MRNLLVTLTLLCIIAGVAYSYCNTSYQQVHFQLSNGVCLQSCANPQFDKCPAKFTIKKRDPTYCGLGLDGVWKNYTYTCQACRYTQNNVGYYYGACNCESMNCGPGTRCLNGNCVAITTCAQINCKTGYQCKQTSTGATCVKSQVKPECKTNDQCKHMEVCDKNKCRPQTCFDIKCDNPFETCQYGVCFMKYDYFCDKATPRIERHYCNLDRPSEKDCPWYPPNFPPAPTYCGVYSNGYQKDFQNICEACKRSNVVYVYNQSCSSIPKKCGPTEKCLNQQCVEVDLCLGVTCKNGQKCNNGICVKVEEPKPCKCIDGYHCEDNVCVPNDPCVGVKCISGFTCVNGKCIDKCSTMKCPGQCKNGECYYPPNGCPYHPCPTDYKCYQNHKCIHINGCPTEPCPAGYKCQNDKCQKIEPPTPEPPKPQPPISTCGTNCDCRSNEICVGNYCKNVFEFEPCKWDWECYGSRCENGRCKNGCK